MVSVQFKMLDLLFTIEHLPALDAENLSVRFGFNGVQSIDKCVPLGGISFYHNALLYRFSLNLD